MSTGAFPPPLDFNEDDGDEPVVDDNGEEKFDEDLNDDLIDSADADRMAAEDDDFDDDEE